MTNHESAMPGGRFNPYKAFHGVFIPEGLVCRSEISMGAKLCYGALCRFAGKNGLAFPSLYTLGESLGIKERQVGSYVLELKTLGLIETEQLGLGRTNRYYFLRHPWIFGPDNGEDPDPQDTADQDLHSLTGSIVPVRPAGSRRPDLQDRATPIVRESVEEIQKKRGKTLSVPERRIVHRTISKRKTSTLDESISRDESGTASDGSSPRARYAGSNRLREWTRPREEWNARDLVRHFSAMDWGPSVDPVNRAALGTGMKAWLKMYNGEEIAYVMERFQLSGTWRFSIYPPWRDFLGKREVSCRELKKRELYKFEPVKVMEDLDIALAEVRSG